MLSRIENHPGLESSLPRQPLASIAFGIAASSLSQSQTLLAILPKGFPQPGSALAAIRCQIR
jgi:hypothetical protein